MSAGGGSQYSTYYTAQLLFARTFGGEKVKLSVLQNVTTTNEISNFFLCLRNSTKLTGSVNLVSVI